MQRPEQPDISTESAVSSDRGEHFPFPSPTSHISQPSLQVPSADTGKQGFDWFGLGVVLVIAAFFALAVRFNVQPPNSLAPVAVLSATGCGLLITALLKLSTVRRPGLLEAALGGFFLALFQFLAAITYPDVFSALVSDTITRQGFLSTWALIAGFSILFSIAGAALGHLAFAPLRPALSKTQEREVGTLEENLDEDDDLVEVGEGDKDQGGDQQGDTRNAAIDSTSPSQARLFVNYLVAVLLFGLAPIVVGFVFSGAYNYMLNSYQFAPGPFPTLRLLSAMLPWQVPFAIKLGGVNASIIIAWLWRIPLFLGNPSLFDLQALEPYVFNGTALALLLLTMYGKDRDSADSSQQLSWLLYLLLLFVLGLLLVLPSNVEMLEGLQGVVQIGNLGIPIRTLHILDGFTFVLNLITGPLLCIGMGVFIRVLGRRYVRNPMSKDLSFTHI